MKELTHALFRLILKAGLLIAIGWGLWTYFVPSNKPGESDSASHAKPVVDPVVVEQRRLDKALAEQAEAAKAAAEPETKPGEERYARGEMMAHGPLKRNGSGEWVKNGVWSNYWANGTLNTYGAYQNGEQVGNWPFWSDSGQFIITNEFKAPVMIAATISQPPAVQQPQNVTPGVQTVDSTPEEGAVTAPEQAAVAEKPSLPPALAALKKKADDTLARGKSKEAYGLYEKMEKNQGLDADTSAYVQFQKGTCRLRENRAADAFKIWAQMRTQYPQTTYAPTSLSMEAGWPGNKTKVDQLNDEILATYPASSEAEGIFLQRVQTTSDSKDYPQACKWMEMYAKNFPDKMQKTELTRQYENLSLAANGDASAKDELEAAFLIRKADEIFNKAAFTEAQKLYEEVIQKYLFTSQAGLASGKTAQCFLARGKDKEALEVFQKLVDKRPKGAELGLSEIVIHAANTKGGDPLRQKATQVLLDKYPKTFEAEQALFVSGALALGKKNHADAQKWWGMLLERFPDTEFRVAVERDLENKESIKPKYKDDSAKKAELALAKKQKEEEKVKNRKRMEKEAGELEMRYVDSSISDLGRMEAAFECAGLNFSIKEYDKALKFYQRVWEEFPESDFAEDAAFNAAQVWYCAGKAEKGDEQLQFIINRYTSSVYRPIAIYCLGNRKILYDGDLEKAWKYYDILMKEYPNTEYAIRAQKFFAEIKKLTKQDLKLQVEHYREKEKALMKKNI